MSDESKGTPRARGDDPDRYGYRLATASSSFVDQRVELIDDGADRFGLAEIDAGALQQRSSGDRCRPT